MSATDELRFAVIAIETAADKMHISTSELVNRLHKQGLIEGRLWKYYPQLHTQSREYVSDDIIEALLVRERKSNSTHQPEAH